MAVADAGGVDSRVGAGLGALRAAFDVVLMEGLVGVRAGLGAGRGRVAYGFAFVFERLVGPSASDAERCQVEHATRDNAASAKVPRLLRKKLLRVARSAARRITAVLFLDLVLFRPEPDPIHRDLIDPRG